MFQQSLVGTSVVRRTVGGEWTLGKWFGKM